MLPSLYADLADWFHVLSPPAEYREEAALYGDLLGGRKEPPRPTLLELGAGAGCNAFHLKQRFACTLTDLSPQMLAASRRINSECEHRVGDMRTLRIAHTFDAVLIHDAICHLLDEADLLAALRTAHAHLRPGGLALFVPDHVRETFRPGASHGGSDEPSGSARGLRYLEWDSQPDPAATRYRVDFALMLREHGDVRVLHDRHDCGLFPRGTWERLIAEAGLRPEPLPPLPPEVEVGVPFLASRP